MADLPAAFVAVLEDQREALNERFAQRIRAGSRVEVGPFLRHLEGAVAPLIGQVHAVLPERTASVVLALYDISLDLFAASLLGPDAKLPWVQRVLTELLPLAPALLAREPQRVTGCLCNAVFQVASQRGARPEQWLRGMQHAAPHCQSVGELLEAGKVAAWQAGMVQFRTAALSAASQLRPELAALVLGMPPSTSTSEMPAVLDRLRTNIWLTAEGATASGAKPEIAAMGFAGAFAGFGGLFFRPPIVSCNGHRLFVSDSKFHWELLADAYGSWFLRENSPLKQTKSVKPMDAAIDRQGTIRWAGQTLAVPHLAQASSFATTGQTLAATIPTSHHVFLFSNSGMPA